MKESEDELIGAERFLKWMHARVGYEKLPMKTYMDGEPYFSSQGAEMSLREFLRREKELIEREETPKEAHERIIGHFFDEKPPKK